MLLVISVVISIKYEYNSLIQIFLKTEKENKSGPGKRLGRKTHSQNNFVNFSQIIIIFTYIIFTYIEFKIINNNKYLKKLLNG